MKYQGHPDERIYRIHSLNLGIFYQISLDFLAKIWPLDFCNDVMILHSIVQLPAVFWSWIVMRSFALKKSLHLWKYWDLTRNVPVFRAKLFITIQVQNTSGHCTIECSTLRYLISVYIRLFIRSFFPRKFNKKVPFKGKKLYFLDINSNVSCISFLEIAKYS